MAGSGVMIAGVISGHAHAGRRRFSGAHDDADADTSWRTGAVFRRRRSEARDQRFVFIADRIHFIFATATTAAAHQRVTHSPFPLGTTSSAAAVGR